MEKRIIDLRKGCALEEVTELGNGMAMATFIVNEETAVKPHKMRSGAFLFRAVSFIGFAAFFTLVVILTGKAAEIVTSPAPAPEVPEMPQVVEEVPEADEDPLEAEKIEAALVEQGYFREDVPLTYIEQDYLQTACDEFGVDYHLMLGLIERETNFRNIPGDGGDSFGFCQVQPKWWSELMEEIGVDDLNDPRQNFRTGCAIMAHLTERFGTIEDALTYYNTGHPGVSEYSRSVLNNAEKWSDDQ